MKGYPGLIRDVIGSFQKLPGIGAKSAERLAFSLLRRRKEDALRLAESIRTMIGGVGYCSTCRNYSEQDLCDICRDDRRNARLICVVEQPEDVFAIERAGEFSGRYFVLHGSISPLDGIGPEELGVDRLEIIAREDDRAHPLHGRDGGLVRGRSSRRSRS